MYGDATQGRSAAGSAATVSGSPVPVARPSTSSSSVSRRRNPGALVLGELRGDHLHRERGAAPGPPQDHRARTARTEVAATRTVRAEL